MSLVGKFGNFEVKQTDRISQEDKAHLERWKEKYERALCIHKAVYDVYRNEWNNYTEEDLEEFQYSGVLIGDYGTLKKIDSLQNEFVKHIFSYFERKYKVSLENNFPKSDLESKYYRYNSKKEMPKELVFDFIDYHTVVDKIIDQLGGMSFQDKAIKEVKDKLKEKCYNSYHDTWNIKVKGNVISYTGYGYVDNYWSRDKYEVHSPDFIRTFMEAISVEQYGESKHIIGIDCLYNYSVYISEDELKNGIVPIGVKVERIKFFKNGRIDIKFKEAEQARQFAREWCGYTLV